MNVNGERVAVHRAAGKLFQINGPATAILIIPSMVLVLGTDDDHDDDDDGGGGKKKPSHLSVMLKKVSK